jgi:hypothetical protein
LKLTLRPLFFDAQLCTIFFNNTNDEDIPMTKLALALGFAVTLAGAPVYATDEAPEEAPVVEEAVEETKGMSEAAPEEMPAVEEAEEETKGMSEAAPEEDEEADDDAEEAED